MLARLRIRFVSMAALALTICLTLVMAIVFFLTDEGFERQMNTAVNMLLANNGEMPLPDVMPDPGISKISEEFSFEARYFSVVTDKDGEVIRINTEQVHAIDEEGAKDIVDAVANERFMYGDDPITAFFEAIAGGDSNKFKGRFHYRGNIYYYDSKVLPDGSVMRVFVDATSRFMIVHQIYYYMFIVCVSILLIFSLLFIFLSERITEPFIKNQEKQKRFITNASHELKTPLTVISANIEMIEMTGNKSKWTESTSRQVKKLSQLVSNLVTLSKLDEKDELILTDVEASKIVSEQAEPFAAVIESAGKTYEKDIAEGIVIKSEARGVQELTSILLDNAQKYCDDNGRVVIKLEQLGKGTKAKGARLTVTNSYADGSGVDYNRFFERFYREDTSHNSKKGGFGIGLSIAQEICNKLGAKIQALYNKQTKEITFSVTFR